MPAKILFVFGTRPEAIKCFPVIHQLRGFADLDVRVCVTAQHRQLLDQVLRVACIRPDIDLNVMRDGQSLPDLTATLVSRLSDVLEHERPDRIIVQGDTTTAMAAALAAFYAKIPVDHIEAGLRSGDLLSPWPEEANRRAISIFAHLHFAPTVGAANNLIAEGVSAEHICVSGNPVIDALRFTRERLADPEHRVGIGDLAAALDARKRVVLVTTHRRENFGDKLDSTLCAIAQLARRSDVQIVFPVHPNPNVRRQVSRNLSDVPGLLLLEPLEYVQFVWLMDRARLILTDSGGIQEEAPGLGKPVLVLRDTTERPEGIEAGTALLVGTEAADIVAAAERLLDDEEAYWRMSRAVNPYGDGHAAERISEAIRNVI